MSLPPRESDGRKTHCDLAHRLRRLSLEIDLAKVEKVVELNAAQLHGAILLARAPSSGPLDDAAARWSNELKEISDGRIGFNANLHLAEASMTDPPHLPEPLQPNDLERVDFDAFLASITAATPYGMRFVGIYLDPDGNLVLTAKSDDDTPLLLRESWRRAGLWVKGHPAIAGARCTFHMTLTHLPTSIWEALDDNALAKLQTWLTRHRELATVVTQEVDTLHLRCMERRAGHVMLGDDIELELGRPPIVTAKELERAIVARFESRLSAPG